MLKRKPKEENSQNSLNRRIIQSTQKQIPVKDLANGVIVTKDNRLLKMIEITAIPFQTLKGSQKNEVRNNFETFLKRSPGNFQIKCVSTPADLGKQIKQVEENLEKEKNTEARQLCEEYKKILINAQKYNVERKFYLIFQNDERANKRRQEEISDQIRRLNENAQRMVENLQSMGNYSKALNNNDIARVFYMLLNRNTYRDVPFEDHYEKIYNKYLASYDDTESLYIPPTEYISPKALYLNDKRYVMCDDKYYSFLYIRSDGYPDAVSCGWLDIFINTYEGVDVDIFFKRKDKRKAKEELKKTLGHTDLDLNTNYNDISDSYENAANKYDSARLMFQALRDDQNLYDISILITVSGNSIAEVNEKIDNLNDDALGYDIKLRGCTFEQEKAFISALPLNNIHPDLEELARRNFPQVSAATLYPFTTFQVIHDNGMYIADGMGNTPVILDLFNLSFVTNPIVFMCGMAGAGKTSSLELMACHARVLGMPVYIVAPEKQDDYRRLCKALGGVFIEIGTGSPYRINIMQIFETDKNVIEKKENMYGTTDHKDLSYLAKRAATVFEFLHTSYPDMSQREQGVLNECIIETYARKGITEDNESLWDDETKTKYKKMPILSDLLDVVKERGKDYETLYYSLKSLTEGAGAHFNGQTNIDVNNTFFVIGTENNPSTISKTLSSFVAHDFFQMKIREDRITKVFYGIDEGWAMLNNEYTGAKVFEDSKLLRGYKSIFVFATQQMADVLKSEYGQAILNNAETRIIMKHKDEDIVYISQYIDLSKSEKQKIKQFTIGQALLLANQTRMPIYFNPSDFEKLLTWNDENTLARYEQYQLEKKRLEELERKRLALLGRAKHVNELFNLQDEYYKTYGNAIINEGLVYGFGKYLRFDDDKYHKVIKEEA